MKKVIKLTESDLNKIVKRILFETEELENIDETLIVIKNANLSQFYNKVRKETKGKKIDLTSISVVLSDKGESSISFKISKESKPVMLVIPFSEENDMGKCPSCEKIKSLNPTAKIVKVNGQDYGTFGKNRKFQVFAIPVNKKVGVTKYSKRAIDLLISDKAEGFRTQVYDDKCPNAPYPSVTDPKRCGGVLTVGYGSTIPTYPELAKYKKGSKFHLSKQKARLYVIKHMDNKVLPVIKEKIKVPLNQNEFDALCLFVYNTNTIGENLTNAINSGDTSDIKKYWSQYVYSKGELMGGLIKRRAEELKLFFK